MAQRHARAADALDKVDPVDIQATIYHLMGLDLTEHMRDALGRTWPLTTGQVINKLLRRA